VVAFVATGAVAAWEITTGQHLYSNMYAKRPEYFDGTVVQSTLARPEQYGQFLLIAMPFLLWSFYQARGPLKLIYAGMVAAACVLMLFTASRLSFIGLAAELLLLAFIFDRRWYVVMLGAAAMVMSFVWWSNVFLSSELRLASKFDSALSDMDDNSIEGRFALTLNGLWMVYDTAGLGVGSAGFPLSLVHRDPPFGKDPGPDGGMAHNLWVQIASEYGILPAAGLAALFLFIARLALQAANRKWPGAAHEIRVLGIVTLVGLVGYLFYGVVTGDALRHSVQWMFFASIVVMGAHLYKARATSSSAVREPQGPALAPGVVARALR
jgi:O-antigen ligase